MEMQLELNTEALRREDPTHENVLASAHVEPDAETRNELFGSGTHNR